MSPVAFEMMIGPAELSSVTIEAALHGSLQTKIKKKSPWRRLGRSRLTADRPI
jgi:hypothetical protein